VLTNFEKKNQIRYLPRHELIWINIYGCINNLLVGDNL